MLITPYQKVHISRYLIQRAAAQKLSADPVETERKCVCYDGLVVIGAEYALETGEVDFFDGVDKVE